MHVMRRAFLVLAIVVPVAATASYLMFGRAVGRASLSHSVARHFGGFARCERLRPDAWRCDAISRDESGGWGPYAVRTARTCWRGTLDRAVRSAAGPRLIAGCVGVRDRIRLSDRIGLTALAPPPGYY